MREKNVLDSDTGREAGCKVCRTVHSCSVILGVVENVPVKLYHASESLQSYKA